MADTKTGNSKGQLLSPDQLSILIDRRYNVQTFHIDLLKYVKKIDKEKISRYPYRISQLLLGCNFSLWRYLFLIYNDVNPSSTHDAMTKFMSLLLQDNTMLFQREVDTQEWLGGYYRNNATDRINRCVDLIIQEGEEIDGGVEFKEQSKNFRHAIAMTPSNFDYSLSIFDQVFDFQKKILNYVESHRKSP